MGLCSPGIALTTEAAELAEDLPFLDLRAFASDAVVKVPARAAGPGFLFLFFPTSFASSAVKTFRFESARAIASASHAAFTFPRDAGRLLVHSAEPLSPAICAMVRPVSTDVAYASMSNPGTT